MPDNTVLVTGAAHGIGHAMAFGLLKAGARVMLMDVDPAALAAAEREARGTAGDRVRSVAGDITAEAAARDAVERCVAAFGRLDALVNNAGINRSHFGDQPGKLWEIPAEQWRRILDVQVNGFFEMTRAALKPMLAQKAGRIVTVTTSLDTMIAGSFGGYGNSKAALEASMAILAADLAGTGVAANVLVPGGPVNTRMVPDDGKTPREAYIQPDIMVAPLLWLLSPAAQGVSGRRFIAANWNPGDPQAAGGPIGWPQLGRQSIHPASTRR